SLSCQTLLSLSFLSFFYNDPCPPDSSTLSLHDALPICLLQQLALYHVYHNFCLPHASLRQPLPQPEPTNGNGSAKRWQPRTPARSEEHTSELQSLTNLVCRLLLEKKKTNTRRQTHDSVN